MCPSCAHALPEWRARRGYACQRWQHPRMDKRWVKLHLPRDISDADYAEIANGVWMLMQLSKHSESRGSWVEPDGQTEMGLLNEWWQGSVDEQKWK